MFAAGNKAGAISIHALLAESDLKTPPQGSRSRIFLSTLSLRRATRLNNPVKIEVMISIHALLAESDLLVTSCMPVSGGFLSTLSLRRATCVIELIKRRLVFLSTLSLRRATHGYSLQKQILAISIHALLAESDGILQKRRHELLISIHALLAESDHFPGADLVRDSQFLSTLSLRRATRGKDDGTEIFGISIHALLAESDVPRRGTGAYRRDFYPRSPCGERRATMQRALGVFSISIHALLAESDLYYGDDLTYADGISIHALLAESDRWARSRHRRSADFYPRSPCGERLKGPCLVGYGVDFYPRSPCGERRVSIHFVHLHKIFLSTLSLRRATMDGTDDITETLFLSTLSLRRATVLSLPFRAVWIISIHALLAESDQ